MIVGTAPRPGGRKQANRDAILELLREHRQTTRTELAHLSGLSKATVTEIVDLLLGEGFVREVGKRQAGRGRSQVVLEFDPEARLVLGAQFDDGSCTAVLADLCARPRLRAIRPIHGPDPAGFVDALCACVEELRPQAHAPILGLGVGAPGSVEPAGRRVTISVPYGWRDVPLADLLEARLGLPVVAANRAKVAALGEVWQGEHETIDDLVYVHVGSGIAAGIVVNGALSFGSSGGAGELGHVTVIPDGPVCGCGNRGCLHTVASEPAIIRLARAKARQVEGTSALSRLTGGLLGQVSLELVRQAAEQGDAAALETLAEAATHLGLALANVVNLVNPRMVVIGGPIAEIGEPFLAPLRREVRRRALWDALADLEIVPSALGHDAGAIGAAALFLERLESIPGPARMSGPPLAASGELRSQHGARSMNPRRAAAATGRRGTRRASRAG